MVDKWLPGRKLSKTFNRCCRYERWEDKDGRGIRKERWVMNDVGVGIATCGGDYSTFLVEKTVTTSVERRLEIGSHRGRKPHSI